MNWMFMLKDPNFWVAAGASIVLTIILIILFRPKKKPSKKNTEVLEMHPDFDKDGHVIYNVFYLHPQYGFKTCTSLNWDKEPPNPDNLVEMAIANIWIHAQDRDNANKKTITLSTRVKAPDSHKVLAVAFKLQEENGKGRWIGVAYNPNQTGIWEKTISFEQNDLSCRIQFSLVAIVLVKGKLHCYNRPEQWNYLE